MLPVQGLPIVRLRTCFSEMVNLNIGRQKIHNAQYVSVSVPMSEGGTNFSVVRQLGEAYKVAMLNARNMTALQGFYMATRGGAEVLHLENTIGSLAPGYEADIAVLDLKPSEFIAWRLQYSKTLFEKLFVLMTLALDNMNKATYVAGKKVFDRSRRDKFQYADQL